MQFQMFLLSCVYVSTAPSVISQFPASVEVHVGDTAVLDCNLEGVVIEYCFQVNWLKVQENSGLLMTHKNYYLDNKPKGPILKCSAFIHNASVNDSGMYYCSVAVGNMVHFGNGSKVTVMDNITELPSVHILMSSESTQQSAVLLACLVSGAAPSQVRLSWDIAGRNESGSTESVWIKNGSSLSLWTQSHVLVSEEKWSWGPVCTCHVEYSGHVFSRSVQPKGSGGKCLNVLYAVSGGAIFIIVLTFSIAACLKCEHLRAKAENTWLRGTGSQYRNYPSERRVRAPRAARTDESEVQYATLDKVILGRRANTVIES